MKLITKMAMRYIMRRLNGFSLMEMMVVLLIVAVVAAASAPMINKKLMSNASERTPWVWTGQGGNIAFNLTGNDNTQVTIGGINPPANITSVLHLNGSLSLTDDNDNNYLLDTADYSLVLTNSKTYNGNSTIFGYNAKGKDVGATAFGKEAEAGNIDVAIGADAKATGGSSVAVGSEAQATGKSSVAIGAEAQATANNAIAIGAGIVNNNKNTIMLGDENTTVFIPGKLAVKGSAVIGSSNGTLSYYAPISQAYLTPDSIDKQGYQLKGNYSTSYATSNPDLTTLTNLISNYSTSSDRRLKNVGKAFVGGLKEIKKLELFNYTYKNDKNKTPRVGVMAQDLQKIFPSAVTKGDDGYLMIRMEDMFYAMINAIKELANNFDKQEKRIKELEKQNEDLLKRIETLEKKAK